MRFLSLILALVGIAFGPADDPPTIAKPKADQRVPLSPRDELGTFQLDPRFTIELSASEPDIVDPVCFCFDVKGDLYVVEMRGYPNGGKGEGQPNFAGRVKKLQDLDGDGYYETSTIFVDQLRFPCGITPWRDGFLIGDAPDLLFVADRKGIGKADVREVLYTGFGNSNIQQMINGLQFHVDGWVHGCNGGNESPVRSMQKPESPVVQLRGMHFRFKPDVPGSLEPTSGGGQYGLAVTTSGHWLTCTNSQHLRHIVLPYQYLNRNQNLAIPYVTLDIPDHGAAARVYRLSPFEAWRLDRTTRRAGSADAKKYPTTELAPGGFITSACGLMVEDGGTFPSQFAGNVLVCDPANNLIHRDVLVPAGSTYRAERHDKECEFLASTDTWFRPVFMAGGPDGSMYVADFYREIIETPLSLPDDIKAKWNLNSRERGRIWRIKPRQPAVRVPKVVKLSDRTNVELSEELASPIGWRRRTAHRILVERAGREPEVIEIWKRLATHRQSATAIAGISLLDATGMLDDELLTRTLTTASVPDEALRQHALQVSERRVTLSKTLKQAIIDCAEVEHPHVRFQLTLSLGSMAFSKEEKLSLVSRLLKRHATDVWMETALLSSVSGLELELLLTLLPHDHVQISFLERLAQLVGAKASVSQLNNHPELREALIKKRSERELAILKGLGPGYAKSIPDFATNMIAVLRESNLSAGRQRLAINLLSYAPWNETEATFRELLSIHSPLGVQQLAIHSVKGYSESGVAELLLSLWPGWSPGMRREAQEVLLSKIAFIEITLDHAEREGFDWRQLDLARREQLLRSRNSRIQRRASQLQAKSGAVNRAQVLAKYEPALKLAGDTTRGKTLFSKQCASCHQLNGAGHAVGPDLKGALVNKTADGMLLDMLEPNREVDPRYVNYVIITKTGRTVTGMISNETASSITLKRAEGIEEVVLRADLDEVQGTGKSLMPENLEDQMTVQDVSDLISYLLSIRSSK